MKKIVLGIILGFTLSIASTIYAEPVSQYLLTKVSYSIFVGGKEYINNDLPALSYKGNTYVPLKSVGDLLGTTVNWNNELRRVEIGYENKAEQNNPVMAKPTPEKPEQGIPAIVDPIPSKPDQDTDKIILDNSYSSFKMAFSSVDKRLSTDNKVLSMAQQKTKIDPKEFLAWWNGLGDQRENYMKNYATELQKLNQDYPLQLSYMYKGETYVYLGNVEVNANGTVWYSYVSDQVKNLEPDQKLN